MSAGIIGSQAFSPNKISGLKLWLDASDISTIIEVGGFVSQWDDKSGNVSNAIQNVGAEQPFTGSRTVGIHNVLDFQEAQGMEIANQPITGTQARTIIIMGFADDSGSPNTLLDLSTVGGSGNRYIIRPDVSIRISGAAQNFVNDPAESGDPAIIIFTHVAGSTMTYDSDNLQVYKNGLLLSPTSNTNPGNSFNTASASTFIGHPTLDGALGEIIIYDKVLSLAERQQVESYLTAKWRIV